MITCAVFASEDPLPVQLNDAWEWIAADSQQATAPKKGWQRLDAQHKPKGPGTIWMRTLIPGQSIQDACLIFDRMFGNFEVWEGPQLLYRYGETGNPSLRHILGYNAHMISLPLHHRQRILHIKLTSIESRIGFVGTVKFGNTWQVISTTVLQENLFTTTIALLSINLGLALLLLFSLRRSQREYLQGGIFCFLIGCYMLLYSPLVSLLFINGGAHLLDLESRLLIFALAGALLAMNSFINTAITRGSEPLIRLCRNYFLIVFLASLLVEGLDIMSSFAFIIKFQILPCIGLSFFITVGSMIHFYIRNKNDRNNVRILLLGIFTFMFFAFHDVLRALKLISNPTVLVPLGILLYQASIVIVLAQRFAAVYRKNIEQAAANARLEVEMLGAEKIRKVLDNINEGILTFDSQFKVDHQFSAQLPHILRIPFDQIPNANIMNLLFRQANLVDVDREQTLAKLEKAFHEVTEATEFSALKLPQEVVIALPDGEHILSVEWTPFSKTENAGLERIMVTIKDLTMRRRIESELANSSRMAFLGKMAGGMGFEINLPLTTIIREMDQVRQLIELAEFDRPGIVASLQNVERLGHRIARVCTGILTFSRQVDFDPFELLPVVSVIDDMLILCAARVETANVELKRRIESEGLSFYCRPTQIVQILLNLLLHALDEIGSSKDRWVEIQIYEKNQYSVIAISNSGPLMNPSKRDHILDSLTSSINSNIGQDLGLSVSRELAEANGGLLILDSASACNRFLLSIPHSAEVHDRNEVAV